jgi:hypothetical protein
MDELAKIASGRTMVSSDVFARDLHKPFVDYGKLGQEGNRPPEPTLGLDPPEGSNPPSTPKPEVMEIDEQLDHDDEPDWRIPYLAHIIQEVLPPDQTQARRLARRAKTFVLLDRELYKRSALGILQRCIPSRTGGNCFRKNTRGLVATTQHLERWSGTLSGKAFTGQLLWPTPPRSYAPVKGANSTRDKRISRPKLSKRSPLHGPLLCGVST